MATIKFNLLIPGRFVLLGLVCWCGSATAIAASLCETHLSYPVPTAALVRMSVHRAHGMTWPSATQTRNSWHPEFSTAEEAMAYFQTPATQYSAEVGESAFFPARFSVLPLAFFNRKPGPNLGIPDEALLFNMSLTDAEVEAHFGGSLNHIRFPHLQDSFAYIRFYIRDQEIIVTEIQSEIYKSLNSPELRARYKAWSQQLLAAFELYVLSGRLSGGNLEPLRIVVAGADYQRRRWRSDFGGIHPDLARMMYRDLPRRLGYRETTIDHAIEWPGHLPSDDSEIPEPIHNGYALALDELRTSTDPVRRRIRTSHTYELAHPFASAWRDVSTHVVAPIAAAPKIVVGRPVALRVPYRKLDPHQMYGGDIHAQAVHARILDELPSWFHDTGLGQSTFVSGATGGAWEVVSREVPGFRFIQWVNNDRHPSLVPQTTSGEGGVGLKGGGRRSLVEDATLPAQLFVARPHSTDSHRVWGGLLESHGLTEFRNHLWLWKLAEGTPIEPSIARPIDIGYMMEFPRRTETGFELVAPDIYFRTDLANSPERIVQFRTLFRSPYRVEACMSMFFSPDFVEVARTLLHHIYPLYGETLRWQDPIRDVPVIEGQADHAAALAFLREIYELNAPAAERILNNFARKTLQTIGFLHGLGGHFGGTATLFLETEDGGVGMTDEPIGALTGGATQFRNVSLFGELRDLDGAVYIPEVPNSPWVDRYKVTANDLAWFQAQDLRHWQETWFWLMTFLRGQHSPPAGIAFPPHPFGDPKMESEIRLVDVPRNPEEAVRVNYVEEQIRASRVLSDRVRIPDSVFTPTALQDFYSDGFRQGQERRNPQNP